MKQRDYIKEILSKKSRLYHPGQRWENLAVRLEGLRSSQIFLARALEACEAFDQDYDISDNGQQTSIMEALERASQHQDAQSEISRYFPIALVACIEGYFRIVFADLINYGSPYRDNAADFDIKLSIGTAISLEAHSVSLGELIAHLRPLNNLQDINCTMSTLTGKEGDKFLDRFKSKRAEIETQLQLFPESDEQIDARIISNINSLFEERHLYCHELCPPLTSGNVGFCLSDTGGVIDTIIEFLWVSEAIVKDLIGMETAAQLEAAPLS